MISTHAPAGGATFVGWNAAAPVTSFLLTPLREGRRRRVICFAHQFFISTHAPAGGATRATSRTFCRVGHFYSRPCGRGDIPEEAHLQELLAHFYSRPCGRGDKDNDYPTVCTPDFYSRPCGRGDAIASIEQAAEHIISTHAPAGGATRPDPVRNAV